MQHPKGVGGSADDTSGADRNAAPPLSRDRGLRVVPPDGAAAPEIGSERPDDVDPRPEDSADDAVLGWRLLGFLMAMGAVVGSVTMLLPHPPGYSELEIFIAIGVAFAGGAAAFLAASRLPRSLLAPAVLASTLIVTFAAYSAGGVGGWFALFYVWVAVYSFYFLAPRTALFQLGAIGVAYAALLISLPLAQDFWLGRWITMMTTLSVTSGLVYTLVARGKRTTAELRELAVERTELAERLEQMARTDALTGLPNRRGWDEGLAREVARADRTGEPLCVALLDIDHFKDFNDRHGHLAGDELLRSLAPAWRGYLRDSDFLIRYGGEEFAVALPDCTLEDAGHLLERLRAAMPGGQTASAGVAEWNGSEDPRALVGRADRALYAAKHSGRDRIAAA